MSRNQGRTQGLLKGFLLQGLKQILHQLFQRMRIQAGTLHLFRGIVVGLKPHGGKSEFLRRVDVGMRHVDTPVEHRRLSEHDVLLVGLVLSSDVLQSLKPHQVHHACTVSKMSYQPTLATFTEQFKT